MSQSWLSSRVIVFMIDLRRIGVTGLLNGIPGRRDQFAFRHHLLILDWLVVPVLCGCARDCARPGAPRGD
jgi:hypothetical protein